MSLTVHDLNNIPLIRAGDQALMECFINLKIFSSDQLDILARFRKFFAVHSFAELLCCEDAQSDKMSSATAVEEAPETTHSRNLFVEIWTSGSAL